MKPKRIIKPNQQHKLLESESQKLKQKLELLKEQIKLKKQQKQMNKTVNSTNSNKPFLKQSETKMNFTQYKSQEDTRLADAFIEMKIENVLAKVKQKGIQNLEQLLVLTEQDIDKWKDIPVGHRIKIRKYIQNQRSSKYSQKQTPKLQILETNQMDIESIIKNRKAQKLFIPLDRQNEQRDTLGQHFAQQLNQQDQQIMIQSLMKAFVQKKQVKGILRKSTKLKRNDLSVHWSMQVEQMEKNKKQSIHYPKEIISKQLFQNAEIASKDDSPKFTTKDNFIQIKSKQNQKSDFPNYKYCWICLKKLNQNIIKEQQRQFCSTKCLTSYQNAMQCQELMKNIEKTEKRYQKFIEQQKEIKSNESTNIEEIDFQIY